MYKFVRVLDKYGNPGTFTGESQPPLEIEHHNRSLIESVKG